jgi:hypothetical protein
MSVRFYLALAISMLCCVPLASASQIAVNFDNLNAACCSSTSLNNHQDSWLTFGVMQINGGAVMADPNATSASNVYAAAMLPASNASDTVEHVEMTFSSPVSDISFDVINGNSASSFVAYTFDTKGNPIGTKIVNLNCSSCSGAVAHVSFNIGGIGEVVVRSSSVSNMIDFAVDTITFNSAGAATPEPGGLALLGSGVIGLWSLRKRIFNR